MVVRHHMGEDEETGPIPRSQAGKYVDREAQNEIGHYQRSLFLRAAILGREDTTHVKQNTLQRLHTLQSQPQVF